MSPKFALLEAIEPRRMMSVVPVTNTNDSGEGSLRYAMAHAVSGDTIDLTNVTGTILLTSGQITTSTSVTLKGPGQDTLAIDGNSTSHIFVVQQHTRLTITDLTLQNGNTDTSGGAVINRGSLDISDSAIKNNTAFLFGGGIYSSGTDVTLDNCTIWGNTVQGALEASGGGVYMEGGTLTVNGSTFSQNMAIGQSNTNLTSGPGNGGGLYLHNTDESTITNSTFGENTAQGGTGGVLANNGQAYGGAIFTNTTTNTILNHTTVAYNDAVGGGSLLAKAMSQGGGVYSIGGGAVTLIGSLVATNSAMTQPDVINTLVRTLGDNLIGIYSGSTLLNNVLGDKLGTVLTPLAPRLAETLADNGGETMTYSLLSGSPAINAGGVSAPTFDQRGFGRRDAADVGAFEANPNHLPTLAVPATPAIAGNGYTQALAVLDGDNDAVTVTPSDSTPLPDWLKLKQINGVWTLVGKPTELDSGISKIVLNATDGFNTTSASVKLKVDIVDVDLSTSGLLRVNGGETDDVISVTLNDDNSQVLVNRNGTLKAFAAADVKKVQVFTFGGNDSVLINAGGNVRSASILGDGNDAFQGGNGRDYVEGGAGKDKLFGGGNFDRLDGGSGNDKLYGENGNDYIHGGNGDDYIDGGLGSNHLFGDGGNDVFYAVSNLKNFVYGGDGDDSGLFNNKDLIDSTERIN